MQTVQTLGADCAAAGRERFFWVQTVQQRAGKDFFWVQTVQTLGADCAAAGPECFFWVQTVQTLGADCADYGRARDPEHWRKMKYMSLDYFCKRSRMCYFSELESLAFSRKSIS